MGRFSFMAMAIVATAAFVLSAWAVHGLRTVFAKDKKNPSSVTLSYRTAFRSARESYVEPPLPKPRETTVVEEAEGATVQNSGQQTPVPAPRHSVGEPATGNDDLPEVVHHVTYEVKPGDRLDKISKLFYGSNNHHEVIIAANPGLKAEKLLPGSTIVIPGLKDVPQAYLDVDVPVTSSGRRSYQVQPGDTLSEIAQRECGSVKDLKRILALNTGLSENIRVGDILELPTKRF